MERPENVSPILHIQKMPWLLWSIGSILLVVLLSFIFWGGIAFTNTLDCRRPNSDQMNCVLRHSLVGITVSEQPIVGLTGARLAQSSGGKGGSSYGVRLDTANGEVMFIPMQSSSSSRKRDIIDEINQFVAEPTDQELHIQHTDLTTLFCMLPFLIMSIFLTPLFVSSISMKFNATTGTLAVRHWNLRESTVSEYPLREIRTAGIENTRSSKGDTTSRVYLQLSNNQRLYLSAWSASGQMQSDQATAQRINRFLAQYVDKNISTTAPISVEPDMSQQLMANPEAMQKIWKAALPYYFNRPEAIRLTREAVAADPTSPAAWFALGRSLTDPVEKRQAFEHMLTLTPPSQYAELAQRELSKLPATTAATVSGAPPIRAATGSTIKLTAPSLIPPHADPTAVHASIPQLLTGVVTLSPPVYRRIAEDPSLTTTAASIVVIVALIVGGLSGFTSDSWQVNSAILPAGPVNAAAQMLLSLSGAVLGWLLGSATCAGVAALIFSGRTDFGEMLRVFGFINLFSLFWLIPGGSLLVVGISAVATLIAIREAADIGTGRAIATAVFSWGIALLITWVVQIVLTLALLAPLVARIGVPA